MVGYFSIVFLVGVSLASNVAGRATGVNNELSDMFAALQKHQACQELLGDELKNIKSCTAVVKDLVKLDVVVANMTAQAAIIYADGVKLVTKFDTCGFKLFTNEIKCLEEVYTSTTALVKKAKEEFTDFETEIETLVAQIEADLKACSTVSGFSSEQFNAIISKCKATF